MVLFHKRVRIEKVLWQHQIPRWFVRPYSNPISAKHGIKVNEEQKSEGFSVPIVVHLEIRHCLQL